MGKCTREKVESQEKSVTFVTFVTLDPSLKYLAMAVRRLGQLLRDFNNDHAHKRVGIRHQELDNICR